MISVINQSPSLKAGDGGKGESSRNSVDGSIEDDASRAAVVALTAFFRCNFEFHD